MKVKFVVFLILTFLMGCSTQRKSEIYGGLAGALTCGVIGGYLGKELSPNQESDSFNAALGVVTGSSLCGIGGYLLGQSTYQSDPRNMEMEPIKIRKKSGQKSSKQHSLNNDYNDLDLSDLSIIQNGEDYTPFIRSIPESLRSKIKKQKIIKYKIKPQLIKTKDGRLLHFSGGDAVEHKYEP